MPELNGKDRSAPIEVKKSDLAKKVEEAPPCSPIAGRAKVIGSKKVLGPSTSSS